MGARAPPQNLTAAAAGWARATDPDGISQAFAIQNNAKHGRYANSVARGAGSRCRILRPQPKRCQTTRDGTRTHNLLLRREAPYPLGHTSVNFKTAELRCGGCSAVEPLWRLRSLRNLEAIEITRQARHRRAETAHPQQFCFPAAWRKWVRRGRAEVGGGGRGGLVMGWKGVGVLTSSLIVALSVRFQNFQSARLSLFH